jgi:CDP-glycerol glycerophosphotransferase (TagB/SpsB family)
MTDQKNNDLETGRKTDINARAKQFSLKKGRIHYTFSLPDGQAPVRSVILRMRGTQQPLKFPFQVKKIRKKGHTLYRCVLDVTKVSMENGFWDIVGIRKDAQGDYEVFMGGQDFVRKIRMILFPCRTKTPDGNLVCAFINGKGRFTIQYRTYDRFYDSVRFSIKENLALICYYLLKPYWDRKKFWLVCEKFSAMAQDNGYYFFRYCMEELPEEEKKHIFYVIDKKCSDYKAVQPYDDQVVQFMSFRYMIMLQAAQLLISSDAIRHFYIWDSPNSFYKSLYQLRKNIVFLQHGVMAFKQCHETFQKSGGNRMALFVVSSEVEQDIIREYFGYDNEEIIITGLPRWDVLEDTSDDAHKEILIMPTWRKWLEDVSDEVFLASDYYRNYKELLTSPKLARLLEEEDLYVNFYIHPKFKQFMGLFSSENTRIRMIPFGEEPLNKLLMSCHMMITDYSSAAWDAYYQKKPVIFYTFDRELYEEVQGSYLDMETDGFGDVVTDLESLFSGISFYCKRDFREKPEFEEKRDRLLTYRDHNNSKRIYERIRSTKFGIKSKYKFIR